MIIFRRFVFFVSILNKMTESATPLHWVDLPLRPLRSPRQSWMSGGGELTYWPVDGDPFPHERGLAEKRTMDIVTIHPVNNRCMYTRTFDRLALVNSISSVECTQTYTQFMASVSAATRRECTIIYSVVDAKNRVPIMVKCSENCGTHCQNFMQNKVVEPR